MNVHMKSSHKDDKDDNFQTIVLERKIQQIKCKYCPLIFSDSIAEYQEHLQSHEQKLVISQVNSLVNEKTGEYECEFCIHEMVFSSKRAFLEHVKSEHYNDICSSWSKCANCGILHPKHWTDHSCYVTTQNKAKNICPVCDTKFESDEHCFQHMDRLHPNYVIEFHLHPCDTCSARRPDKTSLMLHKLSHLSNGSNQGPTIKIISKPLESNLRPLLQHSFKKILPNGATYIGNVQFLLTS